MLRTQVYSATKSSCLEGDSEELKWINEDWEENNIITRLSADYKYVFLYVAPSLQLFTLQTTQGKIQGKSFDWKVCNFPIRPAQQKEWDTLLQKKCEEFQLPWTQPQFLFVAKLKVLPTYIPGESDHSQEEGFYLVPSLFYGLMYSEVHPSKEMKEIEPSEDPVFLLFIGERNPLYLHNPSTEKRKDKQVHSFIIGISETLHTGYSVYKEVGGFKKEILQDWDEQLRTRCDLSLVDYSRKKIGLYIWLNIFPQKNYLGYYETDCEAL